MQAEDADDIKPRFASGGRETEDQIFDFGRIKAVPRSSSRIQASAPLQAWMKGAQSAMKTPVVSSIPARISFRSRAGKRRMGASGLRTRRCRRRVSNQIRRSPR